MSRTAMGSLASPGMVACESGSVRMSSGAYSRRTDSREALVKSRVSAR